MGVDICARIDIELSLGSRRQTRRGTSFLIELDILVTDLNLVTILDAIPLDSHVVFVFDTAKGLLLSPYVIIESAFRPVLSIDTATILPAISVLSCSANRSIAHFVVAVGVNGVSLSCLAIVVALAIGLLDLHYACSGASVVEHTCVARLGSLSEVHLQELVLRDDLLVAAHLRTVEPAALPSAPTTTSFS